MIEASGLRQPTGYAGCRPHAVTSLWCEASRDTAPPKLLARRHAQGRNVTPSIGSFTFTAGSAACCWIPTSAIPSCGPDCGWQCRRRSGARTIPTWSTRTRSDRTARFEKTAERHAGLSQFTAPFLATMKFVDEQGEGAAPTVSVLRALHREHRAAGSRGVPPHALLIRPTA